MPNQHDLTDFLRAENDFHLQSEAWANVPPARREWLTLLAEARFTQPETISLYNAGGFSSRNVENRLSDPLHTACFFVAQETGQPAPGFYSPYKPGQVSPGLDEATDELYTAATVAAARRIHERETAAAQTLRTGEGFLSDILEKGSSIAPVTRTNKSNGRTS